MVNIPFLSSLLLKTKEQLKPVVANVERILAPVTQFVRSNPLTTGVVLGIPAGLGAAQAIGVARKRRAVKSTTGKSRSKTKTKRTKKRKSSTKRKGKKKRSTPRSPNKKIKFTKNGQPYITLKSGKARFIKKSTAKLAKKRKGGFR